MKIRWANVREALGRFGVIREVKYIDTIRVNTLPQKFGEPKKYECLDCASIYFNDYQYNTRLLSPVICSKCGCEVRPESMRSD